MNLARGLSGGETNFVENAGSETEGFGGGRTGDLRTKTEGVHDWGHNRSNDGKTFNRVDKARKLAGTNAS